MIKLFFTTLILCGALVGTTSAKDDTEDNASIISEGTYQGIKGTLYEPFLKLLGSSKLTTVKELKERLDGAKKAFDKFSDAAQKELEETKNTEKQSSKGNISSDEIKAIVATAVQEATKAQAAPAPVTITPPATAAATTTPATPASTSSNPTTPSTATPATPSTATPATPTTPAPAASTTPATPAVPLPGQLATPASK